MRERILFWYSDWQGKGGEEEEEDDVNVWEDNWDDEAVEDDFSKQLRYLRCACPNDGLVLLRTTSFRAELEKQGLKSTEVKR